MPCQTVTVPGSGTNDGTNGGDGSDGTNGGSGGDGSDGTDGGSGGDTIPGGVVSRKNIAIGAGVLGIAYLATRDDNKR